jgi:pilus assembly protein CpaB
MSKSTRALIQIGVALMLALAAGVLIFMWTSKLTKQPKDQTAKVAANVEVVVANKLIRRGFKITEEMVTVRKFTPASRPDGSFAVVSELVGRVLNTDVGINEAITLTKLADVTVMGGGVSALIEPGKRAMSVKGNKVMGLAGFVRPGDRVDVLVTLEEESRGRDREQRHVTKLVLERLKILATGTQLAPPDAEGKSASVDIYTLEVTPIESERLALAALQGTLNFALRNEQDEEKVLTTGSTITKTLAALRPKPKKRAPRPRYKVQVITGGASKTMRF